MNRITNGTKIHVSIVTLFILIIATPTVVSAQTNTSATPFGATSALYGLLGKKASMTEERYDVKENVDKMSSDEKEETYQLLTDATVLSETEEYTLELLQSEKDVARIIDNLTIPLLIVSMIVGIYMLRVEPTIKLIFRFMLGIGGFLFTLIFGYMLMYIVVTGVTS